MKLEQFQWTAARGWAPSLDQAKLGANAQLVLLFGRGGLVVAHDVIALARRTFPRAQVIGCSTGGEIHGAEVHDDTLSLTAIGFEHSRVTVASAPIPGIDHSFDAGVALMRQLDPAGLRHVFVMSEGLLVNSSELVDGVNSVLAPGVTVSGGFAADGNNLRVTEVWCNGEPKKSAAVALGFYGERLDVGVAVTGGWGPFGPDRLITKSHKNVVFEFDGRPALALYKQYLGEYAAGLPAAGLMFPLELQTEGGRVLRALLAVDEKEQSITFAGNMPMGSSARFMVGHIEDLIDGAVAAANAGAAKLGAPAAFSLVVSCNARRAVLKQRVDEEVEAVREVFGPGTALAGFYSYGEIGPAREGSGAQLHNETMTITTFRER